MSRKRSILLGVSFLLSAVVGCWPKSHWWLSHFDNDGDARAGFVACFSAEGRIGSAASADKSTFELDLSTNKPDPQNRRDFAWQNGQPHDFALMWYGGEASFTVDDVGLEDVCACDTIDALQLRCRASKGAGELYDLAIDGEPLDERVEAGGNPPRRPLDILRVDGDFHAGFTLTGKVRFTWDEDAPPKRSQLGFQITAGALVGNGPPLPADCNNNGVDDDLDTAAGISADCNGNGVPDKCDIADGTSEDGNANGVPDECESDCNGNGVPDDSDIADGMSQDCDGNGVPDECQSDLDNDGVPDACDGCPQDPNKVDPGQCGCGVTDIDSDGDGLADCLDDCPNDPGKTDPGACGCGVAETDSDGDGTPDCLDACPDDPDKTEPGECGCGVPDVDEDGDGVIDCHDLCLDTPAGAVVDQFGCALLTAEAGPDVALDEVVAVELQGSALGGKPPYEYAWSASGWDGSVIRNPVVAPTETTTYTLTVTDQSSPVQTATDSVTITINAHPALRYTLTNLGSLSSNNSYPYGINDQGQVVGYYYTDTWEKHAFLYADGAMVDLGTLGGGSACARDINNAGQVVGEAKDANGQWRAFLWDPVNGMQNLGTLGGATSIAYAINESGQVVGYSQVGSVYHAFLYSGGVMGDLDTLDYWQSGAYDINDHTQVVGTLLAYGAGDTTAFLYDDGTLIDLGSPLLSGSQAWVINDAGLIAGHSWATGEHRSFLYAGTTVIDLGTIEGFPKTYAYGISDTGQVVGTVTNSTGTLSHAFVYTGGELLDLNELLPPDHGWEYLAAAYAVNAHGQITGYGRIDGQVRAFLLTPVP